jgi:hypothetical protein
MFNLSELKILKFSIIGIIFGIILMILSEISKFSHMNLLPLGGKSWALWAYPFCFFVSFAGSGYYLKIKNWLIVSIVLFIVFSIIFYMLTSGLLFENLKPFGY